MLSTLSHLISSYGDMAEFTHLVNFLRDRQMRVILDEIRDCNELTGFATLSPDRARYWGLRLHAVTRWALAAITSACEKISAVPDPADAFERRVCA